MTEANSAQAAQGDGAQAAQNDAQGQQQQQGQDAQQQQTPQTPQPAGRKAPSEIMPDATADELRAEIRRVRDEAARSRTENAEALKKLESLDTVEQRLSSLQELMEKQAQENERLRFRTMAIEQGVDPALADVLDMSKFNLEDETAVAEQLKAYANKKPLPNAGKQVSTKQEKGLTLDEISKMSDEEWTQRFDEIVALTGSKSKHSK